MPEEKEGGGSFKVVDKRSFEADGTRRDIPPPEKASRAVPPPAQPSGPVPPAPEPEELFEEGAPSFETLVSYLSTTALFQLGLLAGPSGEKIPSDLTNAKRTIELLEVLEQKTHGNLTPEETRLLEDVLYELRISFVEVSKRQPRRGK